jgi:hypothetical protein
LKKLLLLVAALSLAIGGLPSHRAEALSVPRDCTEFSNLGNRICYDFGVGYVYVYDTATHVYAMATLKRPWANTDQNGNSIPLPVSASSIATDAQCSASGTFNGYPVTYYPAANNNNGPIAIFYIPASQANAYWAWWNAASINSAFVSTVAWMVNSNTGYECVSLP